MRLKLIAHSAILDLSHSSSAKFINGLYMDLPIRVNANNEQVGTLDELEVHLCVIEHSEKWVLL